MKTIIIDGVEYNLTPKALFKKGDWIVTDNQTVLFVDKIYEYDYYVIDTNNWLPYKYTIKVADEKCHLWTIQDAKDGDVLYECNEKKPFIFKELETKHIDDIASYCDIFNSIFNPNEDNWTTLDIVPATKEQRDQLEKAMTDAGYKWNKEERKLEKIEQKPAWSEEDEKILEIITSVLQVNFEPTERFSGYEEYANIDLINWLQSLKDKVQPKPKQEWSEYDKIQLSEAIQMIEANGTWIRNEDAVKKVSNWLKSLKPQNRWKPCDADILLLEQIANGKSNPQDFQASLCSLIEQLKKLKG